MNRCRTESGFPDGARMVVLASRNAAGVLTVQEAEALPAVALVFCEIGREQRSTPSRLAAGEKAC